MTKHIFIINPEAGKKKGTKLIEYIQDNFRHKVILMTKYEGHGVILAKEYAKPGHVIYAIGGDGTVNEVVNGIMQSGCNYQVKLGVIPYGSGNDFIKNFTDLKDPVEVLKGLTTNNFKSIDIGRLNQRYFINIASCGFDAEIAYRAKKYKRLPNIKPELAYIISVFMSLIKMKTNLVTYSIDDNEVGSLELLFASFANGRYYGGGMLVAPKASLDSGKLSFQVVKGVKAYMVLPLLIKYMKGQHDSIKEMVTYSGKHIHIESDKNLCINMDGEILQANYIDVYIEKQAIQVLMPW